MSAKPLIKKCCIPALFCLSVAFLALGLSKSSVGSSAQSSNGLEPDWVFYNGKIVTVNRNFEIAQAVAITGNKFTAVGDNATVQRLAGAKTQQVNLQGKTVIPGMIDNHTHWALSALEARSLKSKFKVFTIDAPSLQVTYQRIADKLKQTPPGEWVVTSCYGYTVTGGGNVNPTRWDLDPISPNNPVYMRRTGIVFVLNSYALNKLGLTKETPLPPGAEKDPKTGELTGLWGGEAADAVRVKITRQWFQEHEPGAVRLELADHLPPMWDAWEWTADQYYEGLKHIQKELNAVGITGAHDMGASPEEFKAFQRLWQEGELTVRLNVVLGLPTRFADADTIIEWIKGYSRGPRQGFGDAMLRLGGLKLDAGNPGFTGEKVRKVLLAANRYDWQLRIHHGGQTDVVINALKEANQESPIKGRRFTLEHGLRPQDESTYKFLADNGVIIAANSLFSYHRRGEGRRPVEPFGDYRKAGLMVTNGSDLAALYYDVEHPLANFYTPVAMSEPDQRATREESLRFLTINGAYASFEEGIKGSIEPGKVADMVVLSGDLLTVPVEEIKDIVVLQTIVDGKLVYKR